MEKYREISGRIIVNFKVKVFAFLNLWIFRLYKLKFSRSIRKFKWESLIMNSYIFRSESWYFYRDVDWTNFHRWFTGSIRRRNFVKQILVCGHDDTLCFLVLFSVWIVGVGRKVKRGHVELRHNGHSRECSGHGDWQNENHWESRPCDCWAGK